MHGHKIINQNGLHFITLTVVGWVDVFTRQAYRELVIDSLRYCQQNKGLTIYAYVIMSNHIHLIVQTRVGYRLSDSIRDFKKFTSKQIVQAIIQNPRESRSEWMLRLFKYYAKFNSNNATYQFWQQHNKPIELTSIKWIQQKLNYIHMNPVRNGIVEYAADYTYSSAKQYIGQQGKLQVTILDIGATEGALDI